MREAASLLGSLTFPPPRLSHPSGLTGARPPAHLRTLRLTALQPLGRPLRAQLPPGALVPHTPSAGHPEKLTSPRTRSSACGNGTAASPPPGSADPGEGRAAGGGNNRSLLPTTASHPLPSVAPGPSSLRKYPAAAADAAAERSSSCWRRDGHEDGLRCLSSAVLPTEQPAGTDLYKLDVILCNYKSRKLSACRCSHPGPFPTVFVH